ncbi:MAG: DUF692 domain-containing protein [Thermodesulfobacteriota bacterium]
MKKSPAAKSQALSPRNNGQAMLETNGSSRAGNLRAGIGLREPHLRRIMEDKPGIDWLEIIADNIIDADETTLSRLDELRRDYALSLHSVGTSIGSVDPLNFDYLKSLKRLIDRLDPFSVSEHLCWSGAHGVHLHDLFPLPMTEETVRHVAGRIERIQDFFGRRILIENVSAYTEFEESEMSEPEFITRIARTSGSGILLDVNNIFINSYNFGLDALEYVENIPGDLVGEIHLGGGEQRDGYILDAHNSRIWDEVWDLYGRAVSRLGAVPTLIEWDNDIPGLEVLLDEADKANRIIESICGT